ncbi:flagellin [Acidobacteria bacterium AB60]|nr:flagellin [Acidobacteria bacterium AB60]
MLSILNSISSLNAQNSMSMTQANLQKSLTQLSTGLRINSGSDDAAGLSIANGLQANISALNQSVQNASNGIGLLQTADGALSQVTTLLNRAVTLATEAANGGITSSGSTSQATALNTEFQSILSEINQIGQSTDFNGQNVFAGNTNPSFTSAQGSLATTTALTNGSTTTITDSATGGTFVFTAGSSSTVADLATAVSNAVTAGTLSAGASVAVTSGHVVVATSTSGDSLSVNSSDTVLGGFSPTNASNNSAVVYINDGTLTGQANTQISTTINTLSATALSLNGKDLTNTGNAATALLAIDSAINSVSAQRGSIGASINRLTAASNVMTNEVQNLTSAQNNIQNADIGKTVANMTQYNVLQSTGMSALQQSNQAQQAVLKLLQ